MAAQVPDAGDELGWHRAESLDYQADLGILLDFTAGGKSAVLDLGCGVGRVAGFLARAGRCVLGVDHDAQLVEEFNRTVGQDLPGAEALVAEVTGLVGANDPLGKESFDRIIAPQNLIQILDRQDDRRRFFEGIQNHLAPDGRAALTFTENLPTAAFNLDAESEIHEANGFTWSSTAWRIDTDEESVTLMRLRELVPPDGPSVFAEASTRFVRLERSGVVEEVASAGLSVDGFRPIPRSERYVDSTLVEISRPTGPPG